MDNHYLFTLGTNPELSATECFIRLQAEELHPTIIAATTTYLIVEVSREIPSSFLHRLGGTDRIARIISSTPKPWGPDTDTAEFIRSLAIPNSPQQKINIGISSIGLQNNFSRQMGMALKKAGKEHSLRLRLIFPAGRSSKLNSAQVIFNDLLVPPNAELVFIKHESTFYLGRTVAIQDIAAYELRDTQRPARDPYVGLLPPKLAQIMLNIATASLPSNATIYDPFCGMGTILQEGWLQGYTMLGSDKEPRMVEASEKNLAWISEQFSRDAESLPHVFHHDVLSPFDPALHGLVDAIVTEPYLGKPLRHPLPAAEVVKWTAPLHKLYLTFLRHAYPLLRPYAPLLLLLPAFRQPNQSQEPFVFFPASILDAIAKLGYIQHQLIPEELTPYYSATPRRTLLYARPDALVGRELTLWKKA